MKEIIVDIIIKSIILKQKKIREKLKKPTADF